VNSHVTDDFRRRYQQLPEPVRRHAREAYELFARDPAHQGLRFKKVHPNLPVYSARVGADYRVVGVLEGADIYWFWIGSHAEYDHLLKQL
jgi:hypothetical protein